MASKAKHTIWPYTENVCGAHNKDGPSVGISTSLHRVAWSRACRVVGGCLSISGICGACLTLKFFLPDLGMLEKDGLSYYLVPDFVLMVIYISSET